MSLRICFFAALLGGVSGHAFAQPALWAEFATTPGDPSYAVHLLDFNDSATPGHVNALQRIQIWFDQSQIDGRFSYSSGTVSGNARWLSVVDEPDGTLGVSVSSGSLNPGSYLGYIEFATDNPQIIPPQIAVRLTIAQRPGSPQYYSTDRYSIATGAVAGSTTQLMNTFSLTYTDGKGSSVTTTGNILVLDEQTTGFWVKCQADHNPVGPQPNKILCQIDPSGLSPGVYYAYATFQDTAGFTSVTREMSLTVAQGASANPDTNDVSLTYTAGKPVSNVVIPLYNASTVRYTVTSDVDWLAVGGAVGQTPGSITLSPQPSRILPVAPNKPAQKLFGHVTVQGQDIASDALVLNVQMTVQPSATVQPPAFFSSVGQLGMESNGSPTAVLTVESTGTDFPFTAQAYVVTPAGGQWLTLGPTAHTTPAAITVLTSTAGLLSGHKYIGYILLSSTQPGIARVTVPITLTVSTASSVLIIKQQLIGLGGSSLSVFPNTLTFSTDPAANLAGPQQLQFNAYGFSNVGLTAQSFDNAQWLAVSPSISDVNGLPIVSLVNTSALTSGTHQGIVQIIDSSGNPLDFALVTLTVP